MDFRHLRYFVAVAEEGTFTRAARRLFIAQPALSKQIQDLEDEIGTRLLVRTARGVSLTPPGAELLEHARSILAREAAARERIRALAPALATARVRAVA
ncbi:MAG TPA: LysR family transcriptional regulator [Longimicrobiaceae bacterium]|jgi:DNA-binding transcriptional LysR family regulator